MNTDELYKVGVEPIKGTFIRYMRTKYGDKPMATIGSFRNGGRYNVAGLFAALYLGFDHETCRAEISQGIAAGIPFKTGAFTAWDYSAELSAVVRLDALSVQTQLGITKSEITVPGNHWTASGIGEHLHKRGDVQALVAPSAQLPTGLCLDVYLDRVKMPSFVKAASNLGTWP